MIHLLIVKDRPIPVCVKLHFTISRNQQINLYRDVAAGTFYNVPAATSFRYSRGDFPKNSLNLRAK
ncbi:hypothetical protein DXA32_19645 [Subdoligranulum sp. OF01-18]|nr:hypothetical protein DXC43_17175 [Subdoligranulum sp. TF05-17AC]RJW77678.1 hypothetical protein DXA32_19645 [Subdoligranulum sp. OF01-18]